MTMKKKMGKKYIKALSEEVVNMSLKSLDLLFLFVFLLPGFNSFSLSITLLLHVQLCEI